jgi:hypothetical protein
MFDSLGSRRARRRVPGWLWLLLAGVLAGAAAVVAVQERYLPPRLSAADSALLRQSYEQADGERRRLMAELQQTRQRLQSAQAELDSLGEQLSGSRATSERLSDDLVAVLQSLPPDPRGGSVEVRAGQFNVRSGALDYQVVLMRDDRLRKPLAGTMQFTVDGESAGGTPTSLKLKPIALNLGSHEVMRGSLPLPEGFKPRQTTVQVLDRAAGKPLGMRVLRVR